jgi:AcrR family transcriptional regulator
MREAVLTTTVSLLATEGLEGTTVAAVAAAAGVHETSVYRNWGSREQLLQEALSAYTDQALPLPDTGNVRADLLQLLGDLAEFLNTPEGPALLRLSVAPQTPKTRRGRDAYWATRLDRTEQVLRRAAERGELRTGLDLRVTVEALLSPLLTRQLLLGEPVDRQLVESTVDLILGGAQAR